MKRKISMFFVLTAIITLLFSAQVVFATNVGDVVNHALYTDIVATINNYQIESFNIDGYTAVVAEDLRNYGFDVTWNPYDKTLNITKGTNDTITSTYSKQYISYQDIGTPAHQVLYTDIQTYINGKYVQSYNINGRTIIYMNDLSAFGRVEWNEYSRVISLTVENLQSYATEVLKLVNIERSKVGASPLVLDERLSKVAENHSKDMATNGYFSHENLSGESPFDRLTKAGIRYNTAGENIAAGQRTPAEVVNAWMNSDGHRKNILNTQYTKMGLGYYNQEGTPYGAYWTQLFARLSGR